MEWSNVAGAPISWPCEFSSDRPGNPSSWQVLWLWLVSNRKRYRFPAPASPPPSDAVSWEVAQVGVEAEGGGVELAAMAGADPSTTAVQAIAPTARVVIRMDGFSLVGPARPLGGVSG